MASFPASILVTGGAGFVGANLCLALAERHPAAEVIALDSLKRRGSELNLARLREAGVGSCTATCASATTSSALEPVDALVECSAEPSVLAGMGAGADFVVQTNLLGAHNCFELARRDGAQVVFLSTSRVYPVAPQTQLALREEETRFALEPVQPFAGASEHGIAEDFPLEGARTLYGATKLAAELLLAEYADAFGVRATIDRCGVIAGPWQMGKVDQGVFTHWLLAHYAEAAAVLHRLRRQRQAGARPAARRRPLRPRARAARRSRGLERRTVNVGGGVAGCLSLRETTDLCRELTGNEVADRAGRRGAPGRRPALRVRLPAAVRAHRLAPARDPRTILEDTLAWIEAHERDVLAALG